VKLVELSTSFGQLEDLQSPGYRVFAADLRKRTRSGREYEESEPTSLDPSSRNFQPSGSTK
ncbi:hypothetical protein VP01_8971g1, partial [Puccinia sorghi]